PETRAGFLLAVSFARRAIGQAGVAARVCRGGAAGKASHGKVEAAPPEMHWARLAGETGAEAREDGQHRGEGLAEAIGGIAVVFTPLGILRAQDRAAHLV